MKVRIQLSSGMHRDIRAWNPHVPRKRHSTQTQAHDWHKEHALDASVWQT